MTRSITVVSLIVVLALSAVTKADSISNLAGQPLGTVNATVGITPITDSSSGFGRFFLSYVFNGNYNAFVFWIGSNNPTGQPFTVSNGQIIFLPGAYEHDSAGLRLETLDIHASGFGQPDTFSINGGLYTFVLPPTVTPDTINFGSEGDKYYINNVSVLISDVPPLPEPGTFTLLASGLLGIVGWTYRDSLKR